MNCITIDNSPETVTRGGNTTTLIKIFQTLECIMTSECNLITLIKSKLSFEAKLFNERDEVLIKSAF
ncbi:unnamed protein product [Rhizophagus irregularis]|nr:unnamed protein product [Rhizophagus irregularis]